MAIQPGKVQLGVSFGGTWSGSYGTTTSGNLQQYQSWWNTGGAGGHAVEAVTHFCYPSFTASAFTSPFSQVSAFYAAGGTVIMSLQLFPADGTGSVTTLLAGGYDSNITAIGQAMAPYPNLIVRLGWEGNGNWFPWATGTIGVSNYQKAWAYIVPRLRAAGFTGLFDLNLENSGGRTPQVTGAGIDPSLVDIVSTDQYATVGIQNSTDVVNAWRTVQKPDFDACAALAASMGKPIGLPEFSTGFKQDGYGAGDDDYYMSQLAAWIQQHNVAYAVVFNGNDYSGSTVVNRHQWADPATINTAGPFTSNSNFPLSIAAWRSAAWTAANLSPTTPAPPVIPPQVPTARRKRTTRFVFSDATAAPVTPATPALVRSGTQITVGAGGARYQSTGWNAYTMRSAGGTPTQTMTDGQRDAFFAGLAPQSLVRVWAFPPKAGTFTDAQALAEQDKIVTSARTYGHRLIFCLADWAGNANDDTGIKTATWLTGTAYTGRYQSWLDTIVARYASDNTVAAWDLLNEPIAPSNTTELLAFVNSMGARVKAADPGALVMLGINTPAISCGSTANYQTVMGSAQIDLVTFHDYYEVPGVNDTFVAARGVALALGKPLLVDELGVWASASYATATTSPAGYTPVSYANQANILNEKLRLYAAYPETVGELLWSNMPAGIPDPAYEPPVGGAARTTVHDFPMATGASPLSPATVAGLEGWLKGVDAWRVANGATTGGKMYRRGTANFYTTTFTAVHDAGGGHPAWQNAANAVFLDWSAVEGTQTWFLVVKPTTLTSGTKHYLVGADNGSGGFAIYIDGSTGKVNLVNEGAASFGVGAAALTANTTYLIEAHLTKTTGAWSIRLNGTLDASGTATVGTFAASSNTALLRQFTWQAGNPFVGYLYEALKYSTDVSTTDSATIRAYLMAEYGLSPNPSPGGNPRDALTITSGTQINSTNTGAATSLLTGGRTSFTQSGVKGTPVDVTITSGNQTIVDTEYHGMVKVNAANVTFKNCIFRGHSSTTNEACVHADQPNISNAVFEDCTFAPDFPSLWVNGINGHAFTLRRCDISNVVDGAGVYDTTSTTGVNLGGTNANPNYATNVVIDRTYIHDLLYWTPDPNHASDNQTHNDGVQIQGGSGTTIKFSNIQAYYGAAGNNQPAPNASPSPSGYTNVGLDCIFMGGQTGAVASGAVVTDNAFGGGYIPLNLTGGSTSSSLGTFLRNKFDGAAGASVSGKPETILTKSTQTGTYGTGTSDANTFYSGAYSGQEILVRTNG